MSHFSVLVIGENVEEQLAPYHEFECTGEDNQYVQTIDRTEEARTKYTTQKTTRYRSADGELHSIFDKEGNFKAGLLRNPGPGEVPPGLFDGGWKDGKGWSGGKVVEIPAEWTKVEVPVREVETEPEWIAEYYGWPVVPFGGRLDLGHKHKFGFVTVDEKGAVVECCDRTNPNAKWDWYTVGGRWGDFFKTASGKVDQCRKGAVDVGGMRDEAGMKAAERFDKFARLTAGLAPVVPWDVVSERMFKGDIEAARKYYRDQPIVKALRADEEARWWDIGDFECGREKYIQGARDRALRTFAVVKDGQWYEKGKMGWWVCVADEKDEEKWTAEFNTLVEGLPDETLLTIVDCHI